MDGENEPAEEEEDAHSETDGDDDDDEHSDTDDDQDEEEVSTISNEESTQVTMPYSEETTSGNVGVVDGNESDSTTLRMYRR